MLATAVFPAGWRPAATLGGVRLSTPSAPETFTSRAPRVQSLASLGAMALLDTPIARLDGTPATVGDITGGRPALLVNVASKCGLTRSTPPWRRSTSGTPVVATVVGLPCNQFGGQEPGSSEEIAEFCSATYGVTFPMTEKVEVNGGGRHPVYADLVDVPDEQGRTGDIAWNFEKFLLDGDGKVVARWNLSGSRRPAGHRGDRARARPGERLSQGTTGRGQLQGPDQARELEVHGVGVAPVAAPGEAPSLEDVHHGPVHLADGPALVARHVEVTAIPRCAGRPARGRGR